MQQTAAGALTKEGLFSEAKSDFLLPMCAAAAAHRWIWVLLLQGM